jgi:hypothetical protein
MAPTIPKICYVACFTEDDGIYHCGHEHATVRDAMNCVVPDGGSFVRAVDASTPANAKNAFAGDPGAGVFRSLDNRELIDFLEALEEMPWNWRNRSTKEARGPATP